MGKKKKNAADEALTQLRSLWRRDGNSLKLLTTINSHRIELKNQRDRAVRESESLRDDKKIRIDQERRMTKQIDELKLELHKKEMEVRTAYFKVNELARLINEADLEVEPPLKYPKSSSEIIKYGTVLFDLVRRRLKKVPPPKQKIEGETYSWSLYPATDCLRSCGMDYELFGQMIVLLCMGGADVGFPSARNLFADASPKFKEKFLKWGEKALPVEDPDEAMANLRRHTQGNPRMVLEKAKSDQPPTFTLDAVCKLCKRVIDEPTETMRYETKSGEIILHKGCAIPLAETLEGLNLITSDDLERFRKGENVVID